MKNMTHISVDFYVFFNYSWLKNRKPWPLASRKDLRMQLQRHFCSY